MKVARREKKREKSVLEAGHKVHRRGRGEYW